MRQLWRRLRTDSSGASLAELIVYVGLLSAFLASVGTAFFQALRVPPVLVDNGLAANELRRGLATLAEDVQSAREATTTADDDLVLTWRTYYGGGSGERMVTYRLHEPERLLLRVYDDGSQPPDPKTTIVARRVLDISFAIDEEARSITTTLVVDAGQGATQTLSLKALMRPELP